MTKTGMVLCFVDPSTMVFGSKDAVTKALDARDGMAPSMLTNGTMMNAMQSVDSNPLWSILDDKGTQTMMKQLLGEAGSVTDFDTVKQAAGSLVVLDGFSARREVRSDDRDRRSFTAATDLVAADGGGDDAQDERRRTRKSRR